MGIPTGPLGTFERRQNPQNTVSRQVELGRTATIFEEGFEKKKLPFKKMQISGWALIMFKQKSGWFAEVTLLNEMCFDFKYSTWKTFIALSQKYFQRRLKIC